MVRVVSLILLLSLMAGCAPMTPEKRAEQEAEQQANREAWEKAQQEAQLQLEAYSEQNPGSMHLYLYPTEAAMAAYKRQKLLKERAKEKGVPLYQVSIEEPWVAFVTTFHSVGPLIKYLRSGAMVPMGYWPNREALLDAIESKNKGWILDRVQEARGMRDRDPKFK